MTDAEKQALLDRVDEHLRSMGIQHLGILYANAGIWNTLGCHFCGRSGRLYTAGYKVPEPRRAEYGILICRDFEACTRRWETKRFREAVAT